MFFFSSSDNNLMMTNSRSTAPNERATSEREREERMNYGTLGPHRAIKVVDGFLVGCSLGDQLYEEVRI